MPREVRKEPPKVKQIDMKTLADRYNQGMPIGVILGVYSFSSGARRFNEREPGPLYR